MLNRAVGAAVAVASRYGLAAEPVVLKDGNNMLVRLGPVVARVATGTARLRTGVAAWLARDLRVARHLAGTGVPATRPAEEIPAGPHEHDGFALTFWRHEPNSPVPIEPHRFAAALADLHDGLAGLDVSDARGPYGDVAVMLSVMAVPDRLRTEARRLEARMRTFPARPLHGDTHPGNLLVRGGDLVWNDFEDAWHGPLGWDLACVRESSLIDGDLVVKHYRGSVAAAEVEVCSRYRRLFGVLWRMFLAETDPRRRAAAAEHLSEWLSRE